MLKLYYNLCKPGIVYGNALTAIAGFFLASHGAFHAGVFFAMLAGISLVIASACVFNNYIDRDIDGKMDRTKDRALVAGQIPLSHAIIFGAVLGAIGIKLLLLYTNLLTAEVAAFGFIVYVFIYTFTKRTTVFSTDIGALSGAVPPVVGYTALTNNLDAGAMLLFLILFIWQMPHFFAISIYREEDYRAAGMPVRPIETGVYRTKLVMALYAAAFVFAVITPTLIGLTGYVYGAVLFVVAAIWLYLTLSGFRSATDDERQEPLLAAPLGSESKLSLHSLSSQDKKWARKVFLFSLIVISVFSLTMILNSLAPLP